MSTTFAEEARLARRKLNWITDVEYVELDTWPPFNMPHSTELCAPGAPRRFASGHKNEVN
jgi:hypothetical protein